MKTRIRVYNNSKAANKVWYSRLVHTFNFSEEELQANSDPIKEINERLAEHFGIDATPVNPDIAEVDAILQPILYKLQNEKKVDEYEIDVLELTDENKKKYRVLVRMQSPAFSVDDQTLKQNGNLNIVYSIRENNEKNYVYEIIAFDTDNIEIFNLITAKADKRKELITVINKERENQQAYNAARTEEERLQLLIQSIPNDVKYSEIKAKTQNVLETIHKLKFGNKNTAYVRELDDALICTRNFISALPFNEDIEIGRTVPRKFYEDEMVAMANKFQKSSRDKMLGVALTALIVTAIIAVCVAALILSWGAAMLPITAMVIAGCAGGSFGFGLFYYAKDDKTVEKSLRALHSAPVPG